MEPLTSTEMEWMKGCGDEVGKGEGESRTSISFDGTLSIQYHELKLINIHYALAKYQ